MKQSVFLTSLFIVTALQEHENINIKTSYILVTHTVSHKGSCINGRLGNINEAKYHWAKWGYNGI